MSFPKGYMFTKDHEWVSLDGDIASVGITSHAADQLGDVVFVELPEVGTSYEHGDVFAVVESVKAAVDCYMPLSGEIIEVNEELEAGYEIMNQDPHGAGWIVRVRATDVSELNELMSAEAYTEYLSTLE
ncbi:glycine cleavage system protein GcvH [bacterium]|nr:glycine cleavage system protein GcvH [candidate division CSSED10-310 bacterium]